MISKKAISPQSISLAQSIHDSKFIWFVLIYLVFLPVSTTLAWFKSGLTAVVVCVFINIIPFLLQAYVGLKYKVIVEGNRGPGRLLYGKEAVKFSYYLIVLSFSLVVFGFMILIIGW